MDNQITRRSLIFAFLTIFLFGVPRPKVYALAQSSSDCLVNKLREFFTHGSSAKVIGEEYIRITPEEADKEILLNLICSVHPNWRTDLIKADRNMLRKMLRDQKVRDFESGSVIKIDGWILSRSEVRLRALFALS